MKDELEKAIWRAASLRNAQAHLQEAMPGTVGMAKAYEGVRTALRIVSRQLGKAEARVHELEEAVKAEECDECGEMIPTDNPDIMSSDHGDACSLNPANGS